MRITSEEAIRAHGISPITPASPSSAPQNAPASVPGSGPAAQVELSDGAKALAATHTAAVKAEAARFLPAVQAAPETRDNLVARLKTQVESGSYHVSASDIAEQAIRRAKADNTQ